ncbi:uncharacterized protein LOC112504275 [Cynara cardunculus var. scolymus]|uniref:uncharacterized protein LOC112504275 n=1 Tax=Cynara cardunculus var. scolymus TaxID=59895 RepID=UPI000D62A1E5|nr:uncharacterized protein LOC112504275 [Cynara cardunculus var. scolymus]
MATAAFKSNSKRSNGSGVGDSPKNNPHNPNPQKQRLRRSLSVSALSRSTQIDISSEFLNKRDNPLYWATGGSPADNTTESSATSAVVAGGGALEPGTSKSSNVAVGQRGRLVKRNSDLRNGGQKEEIVGRRRSLSRVNDNGVGNGNGNDRRGRSVSRARLASGASESDAEQDSGKSVTYGGRSSSIRASNITGKLPVTSVKAFDRRSSHHPSVASPFDSRVSNWEDGISTSSLSEAEEKTIKAVFEQMKSFDGDDSRKDTALSEIYETVRLEVRRAIADIHDDLQDAIRRNSTAAIASTDVTEMSPKLVKPEAVELVLDMRREYAKELEESQERARKLRSDLAIEEHRRQELSRILKETLPEPKTSVPHKPRLGRKRSSERKKMSKRLTDEAMSYFDECVSLSTFDSSDFSAAEDPAVNSVNTTLTKGATTSLPHDIRCISPSGPNCFINEQMIQGDLGSSSTTRSSCDDLITDRVVETAEWERKSRFSFGHKPTEGIELQHDIKNYIKTFEKDTGIDGIVSERSRTNYSIDEYNLLDVHEHLLFDIVLFRNQQESGRLHICSGVAVPFLPLAHLF